MGLCRLRELKNLFIIGNVTANSVRVDQDTIIEYERIRNVANFRQMLKNQNNILFKLVY